MQHSTWERCQISQSLRIPQQRSLNTQVSSNKSTISIPFHHKTSKKLLKTGWQLHRTILCYSSVTKGRQQRIFPFQGINLLSSCAVLPSVKNLFITMETFRFVGIESHEGGAACTLKVPNSWSCSRHDGSSLPIFTACHSCLPFRSVKPPSSR